MADGDFQPNTSERYRGGRGPRDGGGREPGGFRIRLSDNEMRAARAVQEAFLRIGGPQARRVLDLLLTTARTD